MNLLFIGRYRFFTEGTNDYAILPYGDNYWKRYLNVFDKVTVLAEAPPREVENDKSKYTLLTNNAVDVHILDKIENPLIKAKIGKTVRKELIKYIKEADAIIIKMLSNKGLEAIKIATELNKPFMIEMTGDVRGSLTSHGSILRKFYAPIFYFRGKKILYKTPFGMYVTENYLQRLYPIQGKMFGVSDVIIPQPSKEVLNKRIEKINNLKKDNINIGLIGHYTNNRKGVDTAIKALALLKNKAQLHILGQGKSNQWYDFAQKLDVKSQIHFPEVLNGIDKVLEWIDNMDLIILPSRSEGLPRCIVESMSRGCPCITSNVAGLPELIEKKWLHDPNDYKKLAKLIDLMLDSQDNMINQAKINFEKSKSFEKNKINDKRNKFLMEFKNYCENKVEIEYV